MMKMISFTISRVSGTKISRIPYCSSIWQRDNVNYWKSVTRYLHALYNILCFFPAQQCSYTHGISICRYNNLILMDATYGTCRLMLPMFFLAVKTNVGYTLIAPFLLQSEDAASITETLSKIKHYLAQHEISIKNFMIDCSPTEIFTIEETFPGGGLYLCDFHWNQC